MKLQKVLRYLLLILTIYFVAVGLVYLFQKKIIFQGKRLAADHTFSFNQPFQEHHFRAQNGDQIHSLYFPTADTTKGAVLYLHGNADNLDRWGKHAHEFTSRGYAVLMIDYRSYGKSAGVPSELALYEDAELAYDWLSARFPVEQMVIYGRSLGTGVASHLATQRSARLLVLETPFNHIACPIREKVPWLWLLFDFQHRFLTDSRLAKVDYPVWIFQGTKDKVVPMDCAEQLKPLLKDPARFVVLENGGHRGLDTFNLYQETMDVLFP